MKITNFEDEEFLEELETEEYNRKIKYKKKNKKVEKPLIKDESLNKED